MLAVDTNVLVRIFTQDNREQHSRAVALFERHDIWISKTVLIETIWVMASVYKRSVDEAVQALRAIVALKNVHTEDAETVLRAFDCHENGVPFTHALHALSRGSADEFVTFDRRLVKRAQHIGLQVRAL